MSKVTIEKLTHGGKGLTYLDGKACFVEGALPGEVVSIRVVRNKQKHIEAVVTEIHEASPDRVDPFCPYFSKCGGCQWQHLSYPGQLQWKQLILEETLQKIGKVEKPNVLPTVPSPNTIHWRSRILVHGDGKGNVGFYEPNSRRVVDIEECLIATKAVNQQLKIARETLKNKKEDLELRDDNQSGFSQANTLHNENLKRLALEWAKEVPHDFVVELFCGNGNFTKDIITIAKKVVAVDFAEDAIEEAKRSMPEAEFFCGDAAHFFHKYNTEEEIDLLWLDPPRDGCGRMVEGVLKHQPKNILYISCNPATLARDVKYLNSFAGYDLIKSQPIDMFPHTHHIETINLISK